MAESAFSINQNQNESEYSNDEIPAVLQINEVQSNSELNSSRTASAKQTVNSLVSSNYSG